MLLHLRILIECFFSGPKECDDCRVIHFRVLPGFEDAFPATIHKRTKHIDEVAGALNKLLAHFTSTRWEERTKAWDFYREYEPVIHMLADKVEKALPETVKHAYDAGYRKWSHHAPTVKLAK